MVSVIIDNYNYDKYISEAIESVLTQTYQDYEIIIVDDGSKDRSRTIILEYCNKYPDKITALFKPNGGQASAFNAGFAVAKGDIICFLDSDDYWYDNKLEKIVEYHKTYNFVGHNKRFTSGKVNKQCLAYEDKRRYFLCEYGRAYTYNMTTSNISFKREVLEQILPMPEEGFKVCADEYLMLYGLYLDNIKYIDEPLAYYRVHGENAWYGRLNSNRYNSDLKFRVLRNINKKLLSENKRPIPYINNCLQRLLCETEENFIIEQKAYVLYGAGTGAAKLKEYIEFCGGSVVYYCDSNSSRWGETLNGIAIISAETLVEKRADYDKIIIASMWINEISEGLNQLGLQKDRDYIYSEIGFW